MNLTADELRQLRYRLGWSQAEMARCLNTDLESVFKWESGVESLADQYKNALARVYTQAEMNAERVQRRAVAESLMKDRGLSQIHDTEVMECLADAQLKSLAIEENGDR